VALVYEPAIAQLVEATNSKDSLRLRVALKDLRSSDASPLPRWGDRGDLTFGVR
jgi:hypothetical protein